MKDEYFFFEPKSAAFVRGETDKLPTGSSGCILLFMIPFVLAGLLILGLTAREWVRTFALSTNSAETYGTFESKERDDSDDTTSYSVTYRFAVDDQVYVVEESVKYELYASADNGESLLVRYAMQDPNIASIKPVSFVRPLVLTAFCLVWCGLVFGLTLFSLRKLRRRRRLAREGGLTDGELVYCSGYEDSDGDFHLKTQIRFRSPQTGVWLRETYSPLRNDLKGKPLPRPGTPIHVIYIDDNTFEAL
jgi:hypothetical protein